MLEETPHTLSRALYAGPLGKNDPAGACGDGFIWDLSNDFNPWPTPTDYPGVYPFYFEECDDGNTVAGDGCDEYCRIESGYDCSVQEIWNIFAPFPAWMNGENYSPQWSTFTTCWEICGDGIDLGTYECDDANPFSGDGCSSDCTTEQTFASPNALPDGYFDCVTGGGPAPGLGSGQPQVCPEVCGDGHNMGYFPCDDGNLNNNDGCDNTCQWEDGWHCSNAAEQTPYPCLPVCGDKIHPASPTGNPGHRSNVFLMAEYA